jgi:hypothetical protein
MQEKLPDFTVVRNTTEDQDDVIAVYDIRHDTSVDERWPEKVIVVGDTVTTWGKKADYIFPEDKAQSEIIDLISREWYSGEEEDESEHD